MRIHKTISFIIALIAYLTFNITIASAHNDKKNRNLMIGLNIRPSYIIPTHGFYNGYNPEGRPLRHGATTDIQFSTSCPSRDVYLGIGTAAHTFTADDMLGTPVSLYIFQGAPLLSLTESLALGYEWNLGLSYGWKNNGAVTVSPFNAYINVAALFTWRMGRYWTMTFGPEFTHFSNGDTRFPNGGANTINFRAGIRRHMNPSEKLGTEKIFASETSHEGFWKKVSYDISFLRGYRAARILHKGKLHIVNNPFPAAALKVNPLYRFNDYLSTGPSIDLLYDSSANLTISEDGSLAYPSFLQQSCIGVSARAQLEMPVFAVNIGIGYGSSLGNHTRSDLKALYGIFSLKAFITKRLFLNVSYRLSSMQYTHNLLYGIGWRFGELL